MTQFELLAMAITVYMYISIFCKSKKDFLCLIRTFSNFLCSFHNILYNTIVKITDCQGQDRDNCET